MFLISFGKDISKNIELDCNICGFLDYFIEKFNLPPLSVRTRNILINEGIDNLYDFLSMDRDTILKFQNCGQKSYKEIFSIQNVLEDFFELSKTEEIKEMLDEIKNYQNPKKQKISSLYKTLDLGTVDFSNRLHNVLVNNNIRSMEILLLYTEKELLDLPNMGKTSFAELKSFLDNKKIKIGVQCEWDENIDFENQIPAKQKLSIKYKSLDLQSVNFSNRLHNVLVDNNILSIEVLLSYSEKDLLNLPHMGKTCLEELKRFLSKKNIKLGMDFEWDNNEEIQRETMETFFKEINLFIEKQDEKIRLVYNLRIIKNNISTLQDVANILNISRERVRQIEKSLLKKLSRIFRIYKETYDNAFSHYGYIVSFDIEKSALNKYNEFKWVLINVLGHNIDTDYIIDYERKLLLKEMNISSIFNQCHWDKQEYTISEIETSIDGILEDKLNKQEQINYNLVKKQIVEEVLAKQFILCDENKYMLNGDDEENNQYQYNKKQKYFSASKIQRSLKQTNISKIGKRQIKQNIFLKFVCNYCQNPHNIDDIYREYNNYLKNKSLIWAKEYFIEYQAFYNKLQSDNSFLSSLGKVFRYVSFTDEDIIRILQILNLKQYSDVEISTLVIFRRHSELMQQYDIRNEYELHNFIKKFYKDENIDVSRMPKLKFGSINIKKQLLDILATISPASKEEIVASYEEKYGIKKDYIYGYYLPLISEYLINGVYSYNIKKLDESVICNLKRLLTLDYYPIDEVREVISSFGEDVDCYINKYNINRCGYNLLSSLIYKNKFSSVTNLANSIIDNNNILDLSLFSGLFASGAAYNVLQERKQSFDIIEFQPNKFINIKLLKQKNIEKEDIVNFINELENYVGNKFFTINSIYNWGFSYPKLDSCGFDEFFYVNILYSSKKFNIKKVNGTFLFRSIAEPIDSMNFLLTLMQTLRKINIYDLIDYMSDNYKLAIDKYFIISACNLSDELYYSDIMEKVYIDYDEYLNDL